jgi:putative transposase
MLQFTTDEAEGTAPEVLQALDELAREGARRMIAEALRLEADEYVEKMRHLRDGRGHAAVVRNGYAQERTVQLGAGAVKIRAPRVHDRRPEEQFSSRILPPYMRRSPRVEEVLPILYLRGLSTGDFAPALSVLLGPEVAGLSPSTISRLLQVWQKECKEWQGRSLAGKAYVYVWADGVYFKVRLEEDRLACLVLIGVLPDGAKEVIAIEDGYRESKESWASVLRDLKRRGMPAPALAVGDGALGFWAALRDVYPETRGQRCWVHKVANVLDKLPKRMQPRAKSMLHEIMHAPDQKSAREEMDQFVQEYEARYPKATECLTQDADWLFTFYDFPAEHWRHLRTTNAIESGFSTVKARTRKTKGAGSRQAGLALAFKLILAAQERWRKVNAPHLVALVWAGVEFQDGVQIIPRQEEPSPVALEHPFLARIATESVPIHNI